MHLQIALNSFAREVFRDQADRDYIAARALYCVGLREQFLWASQQSLEKYFKATLLFNGRSARREHARRAPNHDYGHDLVRLFEAVKGIPGLELEHPAWLPDFLAYLTRYGNNRYLTRSTYAVGTELARLDEAVWSVRRYASHFRSVIGDRRPPKGLLPVTMRFLNNPANRQRPHAFHPFNGEIERILKNAPSCRKRRALIWCNLFYGGRHRGRVTYRPMGGSAIPPQHRSWSKEPRLARRLSRYVKLT